MDAERCVEADVQRAVEPAYRSLAWQISVCGLVWLVLCVGTWVLSPAQSGSATQLRLSALSALPEAMLATQIAAGGRHFAPLFSTAA
ncbi:hypothetical protein WJX81_006948 [Elliptochloris bilobata]|uniref:Uncharacterized protein n=1 Tax=Elliptochloris bilobata TaxID=381761 RepID=A0AAW1RCH6_9CHLO